jgi:hypothetical protein
MQLTRRLAGTAGILAELDKRSAPDQEEPESEQASDIKPRRVPLPAVDTDEELFFGDKLRESVPAPTEAKVVDGRCTYCETHDGHLTWCLLGSNPGAGRPKDDGVPLPKRPKADSIPSDNLGPASIPVVSGQVRPLPSLPSAIRNLNVTPLFQRQKFARFARKMVYQLEHGCVQQLPYRIVFCDGDRTQTDSGEVWGVARGRRSINLVLEYSGSEDTIPLLTHTICKFPGRAHPRGVAVFTASSVTPPNIAATAPFDKLTAEEWASFAPQVPHADDAPACQAFDSFDEAKQRKRAKKTLASAESEVKITSDMTMPVSFVAFDPPPADSGATTEDSPKVDGAGDKTPASDDAEPIEDKPTEPVSPTRRDSFEILRVSVSSESGSSAASGEEVTQPVAKKNVSCTKCFGALEDVGTSQDYGWKCDMADEPEGCARGCTGHGQSYGWGRFKCKACSNYDICDYWYANARCAEHVFVRFRL